jgi:glycosyltransferase involved in cell wall biosynthesis
LPLDAPARLAFVTSTPLTIRGGSGTYVGIRQLTASLRDRGIRVDVQAPAVAWRAYTLQRLVFNLQVAPLLRRCACDWVVGFDLDGFHYGRRPMAPYVADVKGVIADELRNESGWVRAMLGLQARLERLACGRARLVVATSQYSRRRIAEAYGVPAEKIVVVPEPVDVARWTALGAEAPADPPAVLAVAHLYPRKNIDALLRACGVLRGAGRRFQGWIVGDGPCRAKWEALRDRLGLQSQVRFLGTVPFRELRARYARASIFCLPSRQEGFGIVFLEAMAAGLPVVAGRAAAVPETVHDGETALLVDPADPMALANALETLLADPRRRRAMGEAGRRRVQEYRADRVASLFLERVGAALAGTAAAQVA